MSIQLKAGTFSSKFVFLLLTAFILSALCSTETLANNVIDEELVGIYAIDYQNENGYTTTKYITINQNGNQYIVINISKELNFLRALTLIGFGESVSPLIEEFAITFSAATVEELKSYQVELLIPFPRTTLMEESNIPRAITFRKKDGFISACVTSIAGLLETPTLCYKKLF